MKNLLLITMGILTGCFFTILAGLSTFALMSYESELGYCLVNPLTFDRGSHRHSDQSPQFIDEYHQCRKKSMDELIKKGVYTEEDRDQVIAVQLCPKKYKENVKLFEKVFKDSPYFKELKYFYRDED